MMNVEDIKFKAQLLKELSKQPFVLKGDGFKVSEAPYYKLPMDYVNLNDYTEDISRFEFIAQNIGVEDEVVAALERGYLELPVKSYNNFTFEGKEIDDAICHLIYDNLVCTKIQEIVLESLFLDEVRDSVEVLVKPDTRKNTYQKGILVYVKYVSKPDVSPKALRKQLDFLSQLYTSQRTILFQVNDTTYLRVNFINNFLDSVYTDIVQKEATRKRPRSSSIIISADFDV